MTTHKKHTFQPEFQAVIQDAVQSLRASLSGTLHSIYVYGSVAEGRAVPGRSDLDLTLVLNSSLTSAEKYALTSLDTALTSRHHSVTKIGFDTGLLTEATSPAQQAVWSYWLANFCLPVYGEDLTLKLPPVSLNREIVHGINGDFPVLVRTNLMQLEKRPPLNEIRRIKRETSRRLLRATALLWRDYSSCTYPLPLVLMAEKATGLYPDKCHALNFLLRQAEEPDTAITHFNVVAGTFSRWLREEEKRLLGR
ncbi:nucleotidyltransferase domain-containing protein [Morganella psychrotolerans]|nr:nucleotidyltransferase domain-containing protein [Morganella psychrotolerans]